MKRIIKSYMPLLLLLCMTMMAMQSRQSASTAPQSLTESEQRIPVFKPRTSAIGQ